MDSLTKAMRLERIAAGFDELSSSTDAPAWLGTIAGKYIYDAFDESAFDSQPPPTLLDPAKSIAQLRFRIDAQRVNNRDNLEQGWLGAFMEAIVFFGKLGDDGNDAERMKITCRRLAEYVRQYAKSTEGDGGREPPIRETVNPSIAWLTIADAETISDINRGTISRAVDAGELKGNGKTRRGRRIDAADFTRWVIERAKKPEPVESDEAVRRKLDRAGGG